MAVVRWARRWTRVALAASLSAVAFSAAPVARAAPVVPDAFVDAGVFHYGDATFHGAPTATTLAAPAIGMAADPTGTGYWVATADGRVLAYGAANYGSAEALNLYAPIVGMAATPTGKGYWLVAADGGVFSFGDARFYGSTGAVKLTQPIVGMASTATGKGYWLVAADGGVFAFGDAHFWGSAGKLKLASSIVAMAATPTGKGYWLVGGDGGVFSFGNAAFHGGLGGKPFPGWIVDMTPTKSGKGYWLADADGIVWRYGDAVFYGDNVNTPRTEYISSIARTASGNGYWLLEPNAFPTNFSRPSDGGSRIVTIANGQVRADPIAGYFCNPYGPCEAWCALFATWVWRAAGVGIPHFAFVGDVYTWAAGHTAVLPAAARPRAGDFVLYGTGPQNVDTAVHIGIVAQVWPDGAIDTIEGDAGPGPMGGYNVIINGPFLPAQSLTYNGFPIFAYAVP